MRDFTGCFWKYAQFTGVARGVRPSAILDLWNSKLLTVGAVKRHILQQRTKFRKDRSNRYGDIAIFVIFKQAVAAILNFQKLKILTVSPL